jgi:hypothetical protein
VASDGRWYPPELHPSHAGGAPPMAVDGSATTPADGSRTRSQQIRNGVLLLVGALVLSFGPAYLSDRAFDGLPSAAECLRDRAQLRKRLDALQASPPPGGIRRYEEYSTSMHRVRTVTRPEGGTDYVIEARAACRRR